MTSRVVGGTILTLAIIIIITFAAVNEPARMADFDANWQGRSIEEGAAIFATNCSSCHNVNGTGIPGRAPALNNTNLFNGNRLTEISWEGSTRDFVELTVAAGRPVMSFGQTYENPMPTWSQEYGGPLRVDQVQNVVNFVMNWEVEALARNDVSASTGGGAQVLIDAVGADLDTELPAGDAANGVALFKTTFGCAACHALDAGAEDGIGPALYGIADRAATRKDGYSAERYLHESIILPGEYLVEDFTDNMIGNFGARMTAQDLADVIAYLITLTE